jgi:hypothetical protein
LVIFQDINSYKQINDKQIMVGIPKTLVVRTDVQDAEYQAAVKDLLFQTGPDGKPIERGTYFFKEDNGARIGKLESLAEKLGVADPWKIFNFWSDACYNFLETTKGKYKGISLDYDLLP